MIVHLAGSIRDIETDPIFLRKIINVVHDSGGTIAHNWLEPAIIRNEENTYVTDWKPYVDANLEALKRSDIMIMEATHYAFSQGFQVAAALEHKKPTLLVSRKALDGTLSSGIIDPFLSCKTYTNLEDLEKITATFIQRYTVHTKDLRFNIFLNKSIFKYLDTTSHETGKNKSEIIRELIKRKAEEKDSRG